MAPQAPLRTPRSIPDSQPCQTGVGDSFSATKLSFPCPSLRRKGPPLGPEPHSILAPPSHCLMSDGEVSLAPRST